MSDMAVNTTGNKNLDSISEVLKFFFCLKKAIKNPIKNVPPNPYMPYIPKLSRTCRISTSAPFRSWSMSLDDIKKIPTSYNKNNGNVNMKL